GDRLPDDAVSGNIIPSLADVDVKFDVVNTSALGRSYDADVTLTNVAAGRDLRRLATVFVPAYSRGRVSIPNMRLIELFDGIAAPADAVLSISLAQDGVLQDHKRYQVRV